MISICSYRRLIDKFVIQLLQTARREFEQGGDRIRWTFPSLIVASIQLARRYKYRETFIDNWEARISTLYKFIHQCTSVLYNRVETSGEICLRLYLLALSSADEAGLEELAYEFAVQAFTIYEESISESRAQLQAITLIIGTLQTSRGFGVDNYDTLITKAALHGAKLLKKGQQATAVALASHLWWQMEIPGREGRADKVSSLFCGIMWLNPFSHLDDCYSRPIEMESEYWSACRSLYESLLLLSTNLRVSSCTAMHWINTSTTLSDASMLSVDSRPIALLRC